MLSKDNQNSFTLPQLKLKTAATKLYKNFKFIVDENHFSTTINLAAEKTDFAFMTQNSAINGLFNSSVKLQHQLKLWNS